MTADTTVPTALAAEYLGVHPRTVSKWARKGRIATAAPAPRPGATDRYELAELDRWRDACTAGHGRECQLSTDPFRSGVECSCVACYCGEGYVRGWMGSCARCYRPLVRDGRVVR